MVHKLSKHMGYAKYTVDPWNDGIRNPLIEALNTPETDIDPKRAANKVRKSLSIKPVFNPKIRNAPNYYRKLKIESLRNSLTVFEKHIELYERIFILITVGYENKLFDLDLYENSIAQDPDNDADSDGDSNLDDDSDISTLKGMSIFGPSGIGKTIFLKLMLRKLSKKQVLVHTEFMGIPFFRTQIVYLMIELPQNISRLGFAVSIINEIDRLLNNNHKYFKKYIGSERAKPNTDILLGQVIHLLNTLCVGILVIDESQRFSLARGATDRQMMEYLVEMSNNSKTPILFSGTTETMKLMKDPQQLRRFGLAHSRWFPLPFSWETGEWHRLMKDIFEFQVVRNPVKLTYELSQSIYSWSQGIPSFAVTLFIETQKLVMDSTPVGEIEKITVDHVRTTANSKFSSMEQSLKALATKNVKELESYESYMQLFTDGVPPENQHEAILPEPLSPNTGKSDNGGKKSESPAIVEKPIVPTPESSTEPPVQKKKGSSSSEDYPEDDLRRYDQSNGTTKNDTYNSLKESGFIGIDGTEMEEDN